MDIDSGDEPNVIDKDFGNYKKATVIVEKQTVPDGASASFAFTSTITGKASFNLTDGQQNSTEVTPGVYTATETPVPAGWTLTDITCSGDTFPPNSSDAGATATFNAQSGETIKCVFTNTRDTGKLTVIKQLVPENDPGLFDLKIEDEVVVDDASDGDSGFRVLDTGDYDVSELAGTGTSLAKYDSKVECSNGQSAVPGTSLADVHVTKDSDITCTFTNTRRTGKLTVVKDLIPSNDPGLFDLRINSEVVADDVGDGGSGSRDLAPGDYTVSELAGTGTSLAKYDSKIDCDNGDSGTGTSLAGVSIDSNDDVTCTITNTRRTGKLTVVKDLIPSNDPGLFDLRINSEVVADDVGDGGSGSRDLAPGDYTVSELAGTGTSLADYSSAIECDNGDSGSGTSLAGVSVDSNDDITCTITNTRNPGKLTVVKDLIPANDDGTFNLKIEDEVVATGGDGATGSRDLPPGSYDVSETGAAGTDLTKYDKSISCDNGQSGDGALLANVVLESNDDVTCTITNTRRTGKLTVVKDLIPSNDPGLFDLRINSEVVADDVGDGGSGSRDLAPGDYTVSELAGTGTSLAKYDSKIDCDNGDSGTGTSLAGVSIDSNDDVTCTITNTRRTGKLTVVKDLIPSNDPGLFDLRINSEVVADDVGDGGSGSRDLAPGDYTVSELAGTGTSLAKYDSKIDRATTATAAPARRSRGVSIDSNDDVTCTITNTRRTGKLTVVKQLVPEDDAGLFDLRINSEVVADDASDGDSGSRDLAPGDYTVSELAGTGTSLADYDSSIACDNGDSGSGTSLAGVSRRLQRRHHLHDHQHAARDGEDRQGRRVDGRPDRRRVRLLAEPGPVGQLRSRRGRLQARPTARRRRSRMCSRTTARRIPPTPSPRPTGRASGSAASPVTTTTRRATRRRASRTSSCRPARP